MFKQLSIAAATATIATALSLGIAGAARAQTFDISNTDSWDSLGDPDNEVLTLDIADALGIGSGSGVNMIGVDWDLTIASNPDTISWLSEADIQITDTSGNILFDLDPGTGSSGIGTFAGSESLATPAFLANGLVNVEFYESFDDNPDGIDATFLPVSTLTFNAASAAPVDVPEPASLLGFVLLGGELYRRKRANKVEVTPRSKQ